MSEQEKKSSGNVAGGSALVVVEKLEGGRHTLLRPTDLQDDQSENHHKRSKAPAVPSVEEELKNVPDDTVTKEPSDTKERKESHASVSSEKHKHSAIKKLSSTIKKKISSPESIKQLTSLEMETTKSKLKQPSIQPIPAEIQSVESDASGVIEKVAERRKSDDDSINDEITDLRTPEAKDKISEWSDEEEAGGLPRSDSRSSRVSRAVRQLFCCGATYSPPSEDDISDARGYAHGI